MRTSPRRYAALAAVLLALAACGGDRTSVSPDVPGRTRDAISDGSRAAGNPNFFFLPPLLPDPSRSANFDAGKFVATWKPEVRICRWSGTACVAGAFDRTFAGDQVGLLAEHELYYVLFDTWESAVTPGLYRATVRLPGTQTVTLGFVDLELFADNQSFRNVQNAEIVPLKDGRTIPVKFRIEQGAAVQNTGDYFEGVVTNAGGTFATNTGFAGIYINPDWLPASLSQVTLTIQRIALPGTANDCHAMGPLFSWLRQREGCYQFSTYPAVGVVQADAIVGVCSESPEEEGQVMVKSDATPSGGRRWKGLENVALPPSLAAIINPACESFSGIASLDPPGFGDRVRNTGLALASAVGRMLAPKPAYALDFGVGGRLVEDVDGFSNFGWVIPATLAIADGAGQTVAAGAQADTFIVVAREAHAHEGPGATLSGIPVTFTITGGGGTLASLDAATDANGLARAIYTAGASAGPFTVTAAIPSDSTDAAFPAPDAPPTRTVTFTGSIGTPAATVDSIRVLVTSLPAAVALGPSSEVSVLVGGTVTMQLVPYAGNTPLTDVTCNHNLVNPPSSTTPFASTPTFIGNSFTVTGLAPTTAALWTKVFAVCGSTRRTINVFVTVIG